MLCTHKVVAVHERKLGQQHLNRLVVPALLGPLLLLEQHLDLVLQPTSRILGLQWVQKSRQGAARG